MIKCVYKPTSQAAPRGETHYRCTVCTHERTSKYPPRLLHRKCDISQKPDGLAVRFGRYIQAINRWTAAGKPTRTDEQVESIFKSCQGCEHFNEARSKCQLCGCYLNIGKNARFNKIRMATEHCPLDPPKW